jgi:hypothetical protein
MTHLLSVPWRGYPFAYGLYCTDTVAGVLVAMRHDGVRPFTDEQLDMMAVFADQTALT